MDSPTFVKRVAELIGFDKEIAERVVRATLLNLGTRIDPGEADDLATQLPEAIGVCLCHAWKTQRVPPNEFMRRVACVVPLGTEQGDALRATHSGRKPHDAPSGCIGLGSVVTKGEPW